MIRTPLCDLLGIEKPVFQGGMAWIADASLASAVSNAGGLGVISAMNADAEWLRGQIRAARQATDRPFGVNIMLMSPFADEVAQVVVDEKVPVAITGAGNPTKYMKAWEAAGVKVVPVVASVALARLVERVGATAIVAEG
ncbi:MAG: nitronate monooxygenase, partial [Atopobiaceae bacterium]